MKDRIAVICPTRDRVTNAYDCYISWMKTRYVHTTEEGMETLSTFFFVIDEDQEELYSSMDIKTKDTEILVAPKGRRGMSDSTNYAAKKLAKEYKYVMFVGDDHRFRTANWDVKFKEAIEAMDDWGYVYGNDLLQGAALPTEVMVSSNIINTLGHFIWPVLQHLWIDNYWQALGQAIGKMAYLNDVIVEHMHYSVGKSEHDDAYAAVNNNPMIAHDSRAFAMWSDNIKAVEVSKLLEAMKGNV